MGAFIVQQCRGCHLTLNGVVSCTPWVGMPAETWRAYAARGAKCTCVPPPSSPPPHSPVFRSGKGGCADAEHSGHRPAGAGEILASPHLTSPVERYHVVGGCDQIATGWQGPPFAQGPCGSDGCSCQARARLAVGSSGASWSSVQTVWQPQPVTLSVAASPARHVGQVQAGSITWRIVANRPASP